MKLRFKLAPADLANEYVTPRRLTLLRRQSPEYRPRYGYPRAAISPRESVPRVFTPTIIANAASVVLMHNHLSGDPTLASRLKAVGELLGIRVLDHIVIGADCYRSFSDDGVL